MCLVITLFENLLIFGCYFKTDNMNECLKSQILFKHNQIDQMQIGYTKYFAILNTITYLSIPHY